MTFMIPCRVITCLSKVLSNKDHVNFVKFRVDDSLETSVGVVAMRSCETLGLGPDALSTVKFTVKFQKEYYVMTLGQKKRLQNELFVTEIIVLGENLDHIANQ